jgi:hypothetical protein
MIFPGLFRDTGRGGLLLSDPLRQGENSDAPGNREPSGLRTVLSELLGGFEWRHVVKGTSKTVSFSTDVQKTHGQFEPDMPKERAKCLRLVQSSQILEIAGRPEPEVRIQ